MLPAIVFVIAASAAPAQPPQTTTSNDTAKTMQEELHQYREDLYREAHDHREFLESYYTKVSAAAGSLVVLFLAVLTFLNWKSRKDIDDAVAKRFDEKIGGKINKQIEEMMTHLQAKQDEVDRILKRMNEAKLASATGATYDREQLRGKSVLWVDDHPENNAYEARVLKDSGVKIDEASSTSEALDKLKRGRYDLIITDMSRERKDDGITLIDEVRKIDERLPVVIFCGRKMVERFRDAAEQRKTKITSSTDELFQFVGSYLGSSYDSRQ